MEAALNTSLQQRLVVGRVRPAAPADAGAVAAIWNPVIRDTAITFNSVEKTEGELAALIAERHAAGHGAFVAEVAGRVAGFAFYGQFRGGVGYRHTMEHTIHLSPKARGQGLGRRLMAALETHAAAAGAHAMIAGVSGENPGGRAFHAAIGYQPLAVLPEVGRKFGRWMDLHLMRKPLSPDPRDVS